MKGVLEKWRSPGTCCPVSGSAAPRPAWNCAYKLWQVWRELFVIAQSQERLSPHGEKTACIALLPLPVSLFFFLSPLLLLIGKGSRRIREQSRWKCNLRLFLAMTVNCLGRWIDCLGLKQIRTPGVFWCWIIWSLRTNLKKGFSVHPRIGVINVELRIREEDTWLYL